MIPLLLWLTLLLAAAVPAAARPGDLDASFGGNGVTVAPFDSLGIAEMARLSDGRLIVTSPPDRFASLSLARLLPDGTRDLSFGTDGSTQTGVAATAFSPLAIQRDRRILVAGQGFTTEYNVRPPFVIERYTAEGLPDATFGNGGRVEIRIGTDAPNFTADDVASAMELMPDGRIVLGGSSYSPAGTFFVLIRLLADGSLDPSFDGDGTVLASLSSPGFLAAPNDLILRRDGRILGIGYRTDGRPGAGSVTRSVRGMLVQFRPNGKLDKRFGKRGMTVLRNPDDEGAFVGSVPGPGGRVFALQEPQLGHLRTSFVVRAFTAAGALDRSFGRLGRGLVSLPETPADEGWALAPRAIARQPDRKLLLLGYTSRCFHRGPCDSWLGLARLTAGGRPDPEFGENGHVVTKVGRPDSDFYGSPPSYYATADALVLASDERPLVGGFGRETDEFGLLLARYQDSVAPRSTRLPRSLQVDDEGVARVEVGCREAGPVCNGRIVMSAFRRVGRRRVRFGVANKLFEGSPGSTITVDVPISRRARRAIARGGRLRVAALLRLRDEKGNSASVSRSLTLER